MKNKKIDNIFFTADTHFGHSNIIKYCNRPFSNVDEQDECLIENWNKTVKLTDTIYHLGDFAFGTQSFVKNIIRRLNGTIHFIAGNHDRVLDKNKDIRDMFKTYDKYLEIKVDDSDMPKKYKQVISLFHFPIESWNKRHHGAWHLHGHCVDLETDILTVSGWKKRKDLKTSDSIITYNTAAKKMEVEPGCEIVDIPHYNGTVYQLSGRKLDMRVTSGHTIIRFSRDGKKIYKEIAEKFFERDRASLICCSTLHKPGIKISNDQIKLLILIAADGNIKTETSLVRIRVQKQRKIKYISSILRRLRIEYNKYFSSGMASFNFYLPSSLKQITIKGLDKQLLDCSKNQFEAILDAYKHSDGCNNGAGTIIYSAKEVEIDILQALAVQSGYTATKSGRIHGFSTNMQFQLSVYPAQKLVKNFINIKEKVRKQTVYDEYFWCVKTRNQNFFSRRDGKVHLTGNCHGTLPSSKYQARVDVGVDVWNYAPVSYEEIKNHMSKKEFKIIDHHGKK